jgi:hypothetical protein
MVKEVLLLYDVGDEVPKYLPVEIGAAVNPILDRLRNAGWEVKFIYRRSLPTVSFVAKSPGGAGVFTLCQEDHLVGELSKLFDVG